MTSQDGGLWGLGRWSKPSAPPTVEYDTSTYPASPYYAPPSAPPYAASAPSAPPAHPEYSPYASYPPSSPASESSLYPKIHSPAPAGYPSQGQYPPISSTTPWPSRTDSPYVMAPPQPPQENSSYSPYASGYAPPYAPQGGYTQGYGGGAPYNQIADPTAAYNLPSSPAYPSSPAPYPQAGGSSYGSYPPPLVPPSLEGLSLGGDGRDDGRFRANSMPGRPYGRTDSAPSPYGRTDSAPSPYGRTDSAPSPYVRTDSAPSPYVRMDSAPPPYGRSNSEFMYPQTPGSMGGPPPYARSNSDYLNPQPSPYLSGPIYGGNSGNNVTDIVPVSSPFRHSQPGTLLHGTLEVYIDKAARLPNMDVFSQKISDFASGLAIFQKSKSKTKLSSPNVRITSDPYVTVVVQDARVARTRVISNSVNPEWREHFSIPVAHYVNDIVFTVKDQDVLGTQHMGDVKISVEKVLNGGVVNGWFDVLDSQGRQTKHQAQLCLSASYIPVEQNLIYTQGIPGADSHAVPSTYFPSRMGCRLTLYQDTHIYDHTLPNIRLDGGKVYEPRRCWEDLCAAIYDAQHLIYIAGWSVYDKVRLIRDYNRRIPPGGDLTLGELLKLKASQGVRVRLMIWDDKTSHDFTIVKTEGVMNTHDEETKNYFRGTAVRCVLASRYGASKMSWFRQKVVGTLYSHHQKMTIVDSGPYDRRTVVSFIGGLDLTAGRWDTPSHKLFSSLDHEHKGDFRNKSWTCNPDSGGPREPWHDWHCKIEGHAAYDVLTNFEQRWNKVAKSHDDYQLLNIDRRERLVGPSNRAPLSGDPLLFVTKEYDADTWQVQIFRSIDSGSVKGFPNTFEEVTKEHLVWGKSVAIDISIHMAYVKAIRSAQHFIYIENQYFLGSSYNWPDYKTAGANHLIPMELTLKICSKIREGKRFAVYIVIPMWPEGIPDSGPVQEILFFQTQTMKMMYSLVADTLRDCGLSHQKPIDYLNFYCLGNRETKIHGEPEPRNPPPPNSKQVKVLEPPLCP
ncbi:hypothetical protein M758_9G007300 [Ceratodon purpureus]|nr:hypothetical protein M758_9G007300 [Ceratodon purpureus]